MFQVKIYVDDKKLPNLLWALDGIALGMPEIIPVRNAKAKGQKVISSDPKQGMTLADKAAVYILGLGKSEVTSSDLLDALAKAGGRIGSRGHVVERLKAVGLLNSAGRSKWTVNHEAQLHD
jgi:hypothetical protein